MDVFNINVRLKLCYLSNTVDCIIRVIRFAVNKNFVKKQGSRIKNFCFPDIRTIRY